MSVSGKHIDTPFNFNTSNYFMNNDDIISSKEFEEIKKLKAETKSLTSQRYFEIIKSFALLIGAIFLFLYIQKPESLLNQKSSQETISRERAKLLLEVLKEKDPQKIQIGITIIKASYPNSDNEWINKIENTFQTLSNLKLLDSLPKRLSALIIKKNELLQSLTLEIAGKGISGRHGDAVVANVLRKQIEFIENEIQETAKKFEELKLQAN